MGNVYSNEFRNDNGGTLPITKFVNSFPIVNSILQIEFFFRSYYIGDIIILKVKQFNKHFVVILFPVGI